VTISVNGMKREMQQQSEKRVKLETKKGTAESAKETWLKQHPRSSPRVPHTGYLLTNLSQQLYGPLFEEAVANAARGLESTGGENKIRATPYKFETWSSQLEGVQFPTWLSAGAKHLSMMRTFVRNWMVPDANYRILGPRRVITVHYLDEETGKWRIRPGVYLPKKTHPVHGILIPDNIQAAKLPIQDPMMFDQTALSASQLRQEDPSPKYAEIMDILDHGLVKPPKMTSSSLYHILGLCCDFWNSGCFTSPAQLYDGYRWPSTDTMGEVVIKSQIAAWRSMSADEEETKVFIKAQAGFFERLLEAKQFDLKDFTKLRELPSPGQREDLEWDRYLVREFLPRYSKSWDLPEDAPDWMRAAYVPVKKFHVGSCMNGEGVLSAAANLLLAGGYPNALYVYMLQRCSENAQRYLFMLPSTWEYYQGMDYLVLSHVQFSMGEQLAELHPEWKEIMLTAAPMHKMSKAVQLFMPQYLGKARVDMFRA
jgi:hypothetical protein